MNTNLVHNVLNLIGAIVGILVTTDWTGLGFTGQQAAMIAGGVLVLSNIIKLTINLTRDGASGLFKPQPAVGSIPAVNLPSAYTAGPIMPLVGQAPAPAPTAKLEIHVIPSSPTPPPAPASGPIATEVHLAGSTDHEEGPVAGAI